MAVIACLLCLAFKSNITLQRMQKALFFCCYGDHLCNACACTIRAAQRLAACLKQCAVLLYVGGRATALRCCQNVCSAFFCSTDAPFHLGRLAGWHFDGILSQDVQLAVLSLQSLSQSYSSANACRGACISPLITDALTPASSIVCWQQIVLQPLLLRIAGQPLLGTLSQVVLQPPAHCIFGMLCTCTCAGNWS